MIFLLMLISTFALTSCNDYFEDENEKTVAILTEIEELVFEDMTFVYDGSPKSLPELDLPKGYTAKYYNNEQTEVGEYTEYKTAYFNWPTY